MDKVMSFGINEIKSYGLSVFALTLYYSDRVEVRQFHSKQGAMSCWLRLLNNQSKAA